MIASLVYSLPRAIGEEKKTDRKNRERCRVQPCKHPLLREHLFEAADPVRPGVDPLRSDHKCLSTSAIFSYCVLLVEVKWRAT